MPEPNSLNTAKGRQFQVFAARILSRHFDVNFVIEHPIEIGNPPREHKFDLASIDARYVGESKNFSWTEGSNVPSAKMAFLNQAVFYLHHLPGDTYRFIVMRKDFNEKHNETLAEYYFRTYKHLLNGVHILEIDADTKELREIRT